jgi:hypothetical protein
VFSNDFLNDLLAMGTYNYMIMSFITKFVSMSFLRREATHFQSVIIEGKYR